MIFLDPPWHFGVGQRSPGSWPALLEAGGVLLLDPQLMDEGGGGSGPKRIKALAVSLPS